MRSTREQMYEQQIGADTEQVIASRRSYVMANIGSGRCVWVGYPTQTPWQPERVFQAVKPHFGGVKIQVEMGTHKMGEEVTLVLGWALHELHRVLVKHERKDISDKLHQLETKGEVVSYVVLTVVEDVVYTRDPANFKK